MKVYLGVDLGSTTSKALLLDEQGEILGRGITNSRSNYDVAVDIARTEAFIEARFNLLAKRLHDFADLGDMADSILGALDTEFRISQYEQQLRSLAQALDYAVTYMKADADQRAVAAEILPGIIETMGNEARRHFRLRKAGSSFFRDLATSEYMRLAQDAAKTRGIPFDALANLFDKSIIIVENRGLELSFEANIEKPMATINERFSAKLGPHAAAVRDAIQAVVDCELEIDESVGTGYGRQRLPFPKKQIRSEILCHGLGAHRMFPKTRTVLDIGGQDTKAIQIDGEGVVTSFQMNDRCAAGCGRYLGYIADEMNLGVHELGPLADKSCKPVRINSTCTVFAGAELRDRLTMGQKREDILAGLHRAIILRAMSLLARSGGVESEFTFTGGVANNSAAVSALRGLTVENYGDVKLNISPDSIFTGALGAATFAYRSVHGQEQAA